MLNPVVKSDIKKILPRRRPNSHKGENGRVLIIGGSEHYFGAPILNALGALKSGIDLVHLLVPKINFDVTRCHCPDFIVSSLVGNYPTLKDSPHIALAIREADCIVIGSGMTDLNGVEKRFIANLIEKSAKPMILDALAIEALELVQRSSTNLIITPHAGELSQLLKKPVPEFEDEKINLLKTAAQKRKLTILLKGQTDIIADPNNQIALNKTGNAGLTVGGSGDVLAGLVGGLIAQGLTPFSAAKAATFILGTAGDLLYKEKGYCFTASDLAEKIPTVIRSLT